MEIKPHELFYMPSAAETAIERPQVSVASNIERIIAGALKKALAASIKACPACKNEAFHGVFYKKLTSKET